MLELAMLLVREAVPILTAMAALTGAIAAVIAAWRGQKNAVKIDGVQSKADAAVVKAEAAAFTVQETHKIVNGRIDQLIASIREEAEASIAAARREAERAVVHAKRNAEQKIQAFRDEHAAGPGNAKGPQ